MIRCRGNKPLQEVVSIKFFAKNIFSSEDGELTH